jgi:hypothetical protein
MRRPQILALFGFVLIFAACKGSQTLPSDPKSRLEQYITKSFAVRQAEDRAVMAEFLTGEAKRRLTAWSDAQFLRAFVETKRTFDRLLIREKRTISATEVNITYEISYTEKIDDRVRRITNRKLANLIEEQGLWHIREVRNLSELVEFRDELSLP